MENHERIKSVSEFIDSIKENFQYLKGTDEISSLWFRGEGQVNCVTPVSPKAYRIYGGPFNDEEFNKNTFTQWEGIEGNIKGAFKRESFRFLARSGISADSWNHYFLMQHYGMKTRLLDWTENALLALFFAVNENNYLSNDGRVWILAPHRLNKFTINAICGKSISAIYIPENIKEKTKLIGEKSEKLNMDELCRRYLNLEFENYQDEQLNNTYFPLAIYPNLLDDRMAIQQSCFTIFGNEVNGLLSSEKTNEFLRYVTVDASRKRAIRDELNWLGITYKSMYPDLDGLCNSIEDYYNFDFVLKRIK